MEIFYNKTCVCVCVCVCVFVCLFYVLYYSPRDGELETFKLQFMLA